jgi:N-acetylglucosaminyldiphosphoundecaprenol N-acetyl-beta-D-mannosaminyltransferase
MDVASMADTVDVIRQRIDSGLFTQHVVVNVAKLVNMRKDPELAASVRSCDIINIDGMGVVIGARFLGYPVTERVAGVDLFDHLLAMAGREGYPVFLLGARQEIVDQVQRQVLQDHPGLVVAGHHHGYFWDDEEAVVRQVRASGARLLFVAITSPKKENFINRWRDELGVDFVMGVGGTFDIVAGSTRRAPKWMQNYGLEWLYRTIQEPGRMWKRYLTTNVGFAGLLLRERIRRFKSGT